MRAALLGALTLLVCACQDDPSYSAHQACEDWQRISGSIESPCPPELGLNTQALAPGGPCAQASTDVGTCIPCVKAECCAEALDCFADPACTCPVACGAEVGAPASCPALMQCPNDAAYTGLDACVTARCLAACGRIE